ncbi:MAG: TRAP transporter permease [Thermodesulfobacteriota bacterium]|nr:TRAP transporter permease [Thermodesulfobacteriota bacterium]
MEAGKEIQDQSSLEKSKEIAEGADYGARRLSGPLFYISAGIAFAMSCFQLYTAAFGTLTGMLQRSVHLCFAMILCFLFYPMTKKAKTKTIPIYDLVFAVLGGWAAIYITVFYADLVQRTGNPTSLDMLMGVITILCILEGARRAVGLPLALIASLFILYAFVGPYLPDILAHRGYSVRRVVDHLYLTMEGIFGVPLWVSSTFVFAFVLFGAILEKTGAMGYFMKMAFSLVGHTRGGPAKVAVVASAFFGTISGSGVANVVTIGSITIPLMKRLGFKPEIAGGIETAAGGNGQLMPPVMGAAAFVMAEFLGIPYLHVVTAAILPAVIDQLALLGAVHLLSVKYDLKGMPRRELPKFFPVLIRGTHFLVPIGVLFYYLIVKRATPLTSAAMGIGAIIFIFFIQSLVNSLGWGRENIQKTDIKKEISWKPLISFLVNMADAMYKAARMMAGIGATCACAGIVVGVVTLTGAGLSMSNIIVGLSGGNLFFGLFLTMVACLILGMGVPTTANYVIMATIMAPALKAINPEVPIIAIHLFVFYFGILADGTPPVCVAAYAAAGIAGSDPLKTGINAFKLDMRTFLLPFMFITAPQMLLINTTFIEASWIFISASVGMYALAASMQGFLLTDLRWYERIILFASAVALVKPGLITDALGLIGFAMIYILQKRKMKGAII